jgi:hypothetical protein
MLKEEITIGCGSASADDFLEPGVALANSGNVDYMIFDCLAERTMALAHVRRLQDPTAGQDQRIPQVVEAYAGFLARGGRMIGSFGAANPAAAASEVVTALRSNGIDGARVGVLYGDDVLDIAMQLDVELPELGVRISQMETPVVAANAYIGAQGIVPLLEENCNFILGGRLADPSPYVAAICHELGWALDDWPAIGRATVVGHLLECGIHGAGGNFVDPPFRMLPNVFDLGAPMARVRSDGNIVISKLEDCGGAINEQVIKTQLLYEIHDPAAYLTPDVTADFSKVTVKETGPCSVAVDGATGRPAPETLKVLVGLDLGWKVVGEASMGAAGCMGRAQFSAEILRKRLEPLMDEITEMRIDLHGVNALFEDAVPLSAEPPEVRLRLAARCVSLSTAKRVAQEIDFMYFATAGTGGISHSIVPAIGVTPASIPRNAVKLTTEVVTA